MNCSSREYVRLLNKKIAEGFKDLTNERFWELLHQKFGKDESLGKTCNCEHCQVIKIIENNQRIIERLNKRIEEVNDMECWSKECMGCEWDLVRNELSKIRDGDKYGK